MRIIVLLLFLIAFNANSIVAQQKPIEIRNDFKKFYDKQEIEGAFLLYNFKQGKISAYNPTFLEEQHSPASTFKILHSLIALETGIIPDTNYILKWDSVKRMNPLWNTDHTMAMAFRNSTVWFYQEIARRIGEKLMKKWVDTVRYGNRNISGGIDYFWLTGGLKISAFEQIDFIKRLYENKLPFSQKNQELVKSLMLNEQFPNYSIYRKTGWAMENDLNIAWDLGYVQTTDNIYFFVNQVYTQDTSNNELGRIRRENTNKILNELKVTVFGELKITSLNQQCYVYTTYKKLKEQLFPSNSMYIVTDTGIVLFDTPWDSVQFQPLLDSIEARHHQQVIACIVTHFHDDRTAGLNYYKSKGIKTYSSKKTWDLGKSKKEPYADFYFTKDTVFTFGKTKIETYFPGAGHSQDNIVLWIASNKLLYGGCFVKSTESSGLGNIADADLKAWKSSVKKLMRKYSQPLYIIPGHYSWSDLGSLEHTYQLLKIK